LIIFARGDPLALFEQEREQKRPPPLAMVEGWTLNSVPQNSQARTIFELLDLFAQTREQNRLFSVGQDSNSLPQNSQDLMIAMAYLYHTPAQPAKTRNSTQSFHGNFEQWRMPRWRGTDRANRVEGESTMNGYTGEIVIRLRRRDSETIEQVVRSIKEVVPVQSIASVKPVKDYGHRFRTEE
jgi:hypothetical protein